MATSLLMDRNNKGNKDHGFHYHHRISSTQTGAGGMGSAYTRVGARGARPYSVPASGRRSRQKARPDLVEQSYIFDPISKTELDEHCRSARIAAIILADDGDHAAMLQTRWLIAGHVEDSIGGLVDADSAGVESVFHELGPLGVVELSRDVFWCDKVAAIDEAEWIHSSRGATMDDLIIGLHFRGGRRHLPLRGAVGSFMQQEYDDWPFQGLTLVREYLEAVDGAGGFVAIEEAWVRGSGVAEGSAQAHEQRTGTASLRVLVKFDQLDVTNPVAIENLCRRQVQRELAVERCPSHPNSWVSCKSCGAP